jgi:hypothetical protein
VLLGPILTDGGPEKPSPRMDAEMAQSASVPLTIGTSCRSGCRAGVHSSSDAARPGEDAAALSSYTRTSSGDSISSWPVYVPGSLGVKRTTSLFASAGGGAAARSAGLPEHSIAQHSTAQHSTA